MAAPSPVDTWQYLTGFLNPVSSSIPVTSATSTPWMSWPTRSTASTSSPAAVSRRAISSGAGTGCCLVKPRAAQQPGQRNSHHASIPSALLNRTSPSRVSLMSVTPCLIIRVRSMPSPNANPL